MLVIYFEPKVIERDKDYWLNHDHYAVHDIQWDNDVEAEVIVSTPFESLSKQECLDYIKEATK